MVRIGWGRQTKPQFCVCRQGAPSRPGIELAIKSWNASGPAGLIEITRTQGLASRVQGLEITSRGSRLGKPVKVRYCHIF